MPGQKMFEKSSIENQFNQFQVLEKHTYPVWIRFFCFSTLLIFLYAIPQFLIKELACHRELSEKIFIAKNNFNRQNYEKAIELYSKILDKYPSYQLGRIQLAKAYFALSSKNAKFYYTGIRHLPDKSYTKREIAKIIEFLPLEYRDDFKSLFKKQDKS